MEAKNDMVSFRAGALNDRLRSGPLTAGGKTKRDLARYYGLLEQEMGEWWREIGGTDASWEVIVAFVSTRYWDTIPSPEAFHAHFGSFVRSPMASSFDKNSKANADAMLRGANSLTVAAIIDRAEVSQPSDATAGATSAAS